MGQRNPECSECHERIFNFVSTDAKVEPVQGYNDTVRVNYACRTSSQGGEKVFVCLKCCRWSKTRASQVRCICEKKKKKMTEDTASNNLDSEGDNHSALDVNDSKGDVNDSGGDQQVDLGEDDEESPLMDDQSKMKQAIEDHFNNPSLWSEASRKFFQRENRKAGDGKKGIVYNALIDPKQELDFDLLSEKEPNYQYHLTSTFHGMP